MLGAARTGDVTEDIAAKFKSLARRVNYDDGIVPTELYANCLFLRDACALNTSN